MIFLFFLCLTGWLGVGSAQEPRIVGESFVTNPSKFSYQVFLQNHGKHVCGGTIIDDRHVLTAAHCVIKEGKVVGMSSLTVLVGGLNIFHDSNNAFKRITSISVHEDYFMNKSYISNDIAVLRIAGSFKPFSANVNSLELGRIKPKVNTQCVVSGWGSLETDSDMSADLQAVTVPLVSFEYCNNMYKHILNPNATVLCAGVMSKYSCQGDSGGPLVCEGKLTGVVLYGIGCGFDQFPGVYTDVSRFFDWVVEQKRKSLAVKSTLSMNLVGSILLVYSQFLS